MNINLRLLLRGGSLRGQLLRGASGSVLVKVANVGLGLALATVLARKLGPDSYGVYAYVYALVALLAIPAQFGLPALVVRETAKAEAHQQWSMMRGLWRWAGGVTGTASLGLAIIGGGIAWFFADEFSSTQLSTFSWGLVLMPLIALCSLQGGVLRGLHKVVQGQLPEQLVRPIILIILIFSIELLGKQHLTADRAMALHGLAAIIAYMFGAWLLWRERPLPVAARPKPIYDRRHWCASALPLAVISGVSLLNTQTDVIMLGIFADASDVGIYRVAALGSTAVTFAFEAIGMATMPYFARFHTNREMLQLQRLAAMSATASLVVALPVLVVFLLFGGTILGAVFGSGYSAGYLVLAILAVAQFFNAGFGMVGRILNMTGYETDTAKGMGVAVALNIAFNSVLIPSYGMAGAAVATTASMLVWNVILRRKVRQRLNIDSTVLGLLKRNRPALDNDASSEVALR